MLTFVLLDPLGTHESFELRLLNLLGDCLTCTLKPTLKHTLDLTLDTTLERSKNLPPAETYLLLFDGLNGRRSAAAEDRRTVPDSHEVAFGGCSAYRQRCKKKTFDRGTAV